MAATDSIRDTLDAHDLVGTRITEAKAICTVLAISTSESNEAPPSLELVSLALDGVTALLKEAESAMTEINCRPLRQVA